MDSTRDFPCLLPAPKRARRAPYAESSGRTFQQLQGCTPLEYGARLCTELLDPLHAAQTLIASHVPPAAIQAYMIAEDDHARRNPCNTLSPACDCLEFTLEEARHLVCLTKATLRNKIFPGPAHWTEHEHGKWGENDLLAALALGTMRTLPMDYQRIYMLQWLQMLGDTGFHDIVECSFMFFLQKQLQ